MATFLTFFFWPVVWATLAVLSVIFKPSMWLAIWQWFIADPANHAFQIVTAYFAWRLFAFAVRFINELFESRHLVSMKVLLPRSDSKNDQEKRTEKDFKEK